MSRACDLVDGRGVRTDTAATRRVGGVARGAPLGARARRGPTWPFVRAPEPERRSSSKSPRHTRAAEAFAIPAIEYGTGSARRVDTARMVRCAVDQRRPSGAL